MKLTILLAATVTLCAGNAIRLVPGDNSHYVEGESRYIWMPDGEGIPHLVDLQAPEITEDVIRQARESRAGAGNAYWLYTRANPNNPQTIVHGNANTIWSSNFDVHKPLKVLVHGWRSSGNSNMPVETRQAFLDTSDVNVIVLDWSRAAGSITYILSANRVPNVGQYLGNFLVWLQGETGVSWNNIHLIGFSLGAHVVGNAGRTTGSRVIRITGLDPAGPNFGNNNNALRASDGHYVEAIHTDGGSLGINDPIGRTDFYPNGGRNAQPGCSLSTCSHNRAYQFFAASLHFNHFIGRQCTNHSQANNNQCTGETLHMGNAILSKFGNGLYALSTGNSWPY